MWPLIEYPVNNILSAIHLTTTWIIIYTTMKYNKLKTWIKLFVVSLK